MSTGVYRRLWDYRLRQRVVFKSSAAPSVVSVLIRSDQSRTWHSKNNRIDTRHEYFHVPRPRKYSITWEQPPIFRQLQPFDYQKWQANHNRVDTRLDYYHIPRPRFYLITTTPPPAISQILPGFNFALRYTLYDRDGLEVYYHNKKPIHVPTKFIVPPSGFTYEFDRNPPGWHRSYTL